MAILATAMDMDLAMAVMGMESAMLMLSQRLMPMLSTVLMEDMVLDTALIPWDMVMAILATLLLATAVDMVLAMAVMGMESAMLKLSQSLMLSMEPMVGMAMDLVTVHTLWDMDMAMVMDMDIDIMVELSDTTNQARHYNNCNDNALWSKYSSLFSLNIV